MNLRENEVLDAEDAVTETMYKTIEILKIIR